MNLEDVKDIKIKELLARNSLQAEVIEALEKNFSFSASVLMAFVRTSQKPCLVSDEEYNDALYFATYYLRRVHERQREERESRKVNQESKGQIKETKYVVRNKEVKGKTK